MSFIDEDLTYLFSKITGPFSTKLRMIACRYKLMKIHQHSAGHINKMAAMPYMVKHFKNLLSINHWADFDETLYEASEA